MPTKKKALKKKAPAVDAAKLEQWKKQGRVLKVAEVHLRNTEFSHQWKIADWMLAGEKEFKKKAYDEAVELTGMTRETLQQFAHTAKKVLIRVKGLSFGHHRLVAKFWREPQKQEKELYYAKNKRPRPLSVEKFALHLKGLETEHKRQKNTPTNSDWCAKKFEEHCDELVSHKLLQALMDGDPPEAERRQTLVSKLKKTAEKLNEIVPELQHHWQLYLPLPWGVGFSRKEDYEEWKRRQAAAKSAAAGGGQ